MTVPVRGLDGKKITQIACGQQHSIAMDSDGYVELRISSTLMLSLLQCRLCMGLQRVLPSRVGKPTRRSHPQACTTGMFSTRPPCEGCEVSSHSRSVRRPQRDDDGIRHSCRTVQLSRYRQTGDVLDGWQGHSPTFERVALADATQWKNTGDGSSGQPYSSFRYMQDIMYVFRSLRLRTPTDIWGC